MKGRGKNDKRGGREERRGEERGGKGKVRTRV